jgi:hypothetical protein
VLKVGTAVAAGAVSCKSCRSVEATLWVLVGRDLSCKHPLLPFSPLQYGRGGSSVVPAASSPCGAVVLCCGANTPLLQCAGTAGAACDGLLVLVCLQTVFGC